jgi:hypothetical protein
VEGSVGRWVSGRVGGAESETQWRGRDAKVPLVWSFWTGDEQHGSVVR